MNHVVVLTFKTLKTHHRPQYFWSGFKYLLHFFSPLCWIIRLNNKVWLKVCLTGFFSHFYFLPFIFPPVPCLPSTELRPYFLFGDECEKESNHAQSPSISANQLCETEDPRPAGNKEIHNCDNEKRISPLYLFQNPTARPSRSFQPGGWKRV